MANLKAVPDGWNIKTVAEVAHNFDGKRIALKSTDRANRKGGYRYYGASNIIDYVDDYIFDGDYILLGEDGDNVLSRNLPLAFIVSGKFWVNNHAHVLQPKENIDIGYLCEVLEAFDYKNIASGSAQPKITQGALNQISLLFPPLPEQQKIAAILTSVDEVIEKTQAQIDKLKDLKTAMMQTLLTNGVGTKPASADAALNNGTASRENYIPHTEFKDSPVGRIPKSWEVVELGNRASLVPGYAFKSTDFTSNGVPLIRMGNLYNNKLDLKRAPKFLPENFISNHSKFVVHENDIVFSMTGTVGKEDYGFAVQIPKSTTPCLLNQRVAKVVTKKLLITNFLLHLMRSRLFLDEIYAVGTGTKQANLSSANILNVVLPFPPVDEQRKIASVLDSIEERITTLKKRHQKQTILKKALMQDLLTGKVRVKVD
jgi:type I restriction enzyme S subunit